VAKQHSPAFLALVQDAKQRIRQTTIPELKKKLDAREEFHLIDVREDHEWTAGHIPGAVHLSKGIIERDIEEKFPNREAEILLYCGGGYRSALVADNLQKMGYQRVVSVDGGWRAWRAAGYAVKKVASS
jgi:rhodanese-related sulfurtransferase